MFASIVTKLLGLASHDFIPVVSLVVGAVVTIGGDLVLRQARTAGAATATAECAAQAAQQSADVVQNLEAQVQRQTQIVRDAHAAVIAAEQRAAAAHRALDAERVAHTKTKESVACAAGCKVHLP